MAYIGQGIEQFSNVEKLDNITFTNSAGPYNLTKGSVAFTPSNAQSLLIEVDGIMQSSDSYTVSGSTITFGVSMASTSTMNNILHLGVGLISTPADDTVSTSAIVDNAVTTAKIVDSNVTNAKLAGSIANAKLANSAITINGSAVSLGGSVTVGETKPTISSISPSVIDNTTSTITITGTNYISVPYVDLINASTGAITQASTVSFTNATTLVITTTLSVDGTYYLRIENNDGNAVRSSTALLTVSDAPAWTTSAGSLGSFAGGSSIGTINLTATDSTSMAVQSGSLPGGITLNSSAGTSTLTGTESGASADTTYNFTIRATDAEAQTADRAFSLTFTFGASNSIQFN